MSEITDAVALLRERAETLESVAGVEVNRRTHLALADLLEGIAENHQQDAGTGWCRGCRTIGCDDYHAARAAADALVSP